MSDLHKQKAIRIYQESLREHEELVSHGANPNGTDTWKGNIFDADKIAKELIAPQIVDKGERFLIKQKWIQRMDDYEALIKSTPLNQWTFEMSLFNRKSEVYTTRWYSDTMVRRAIQLQIEI